MAISLRDILRTDLLVYEFVPTGERVVGLLQGDVPTCADFYLTSGGQVIIPKYTSPNNGRYIGRFRGNFEFTPGKIIPASDVRTIFPDVDIPTIDQLLELFEKAPEKIKESEIQARQDIQRFLDVGRIIQN